MPMVVSMLRGLNLGAHNRIRMEALRAIYESLGLSDVQSYVQSGNILYRTVRRDLDALARRIEEAMLETHGIRTAVIQRSAGDLRGVTERNPFAGRPGLDPAKLAVHFLGGTPGAEECAAARAIAIAPEEMHILEREMFVYFPDGMGRSRFPAAKLEKALKCAGTARNWNTVTKLLELAEAAPTRR
jgi:uncharacterized protein (DUF1697 family)